MQVLNGAGNFALAVEVEAPVGGNATSLTDTLKSVIVEVQGTVTCRLIGVEETFEQISRHAMLEYTQITLVRVVVVGSGGKSSAVAAIEADVATHVHVGG